MLAPPAAVRRSGKVFTSTGTMVSLTCAKRRMSDGEAVRTEEPASRTEDSQRFTQRRVLVGR
jgi:hypothetical protein